MLVKTNNRGQISNLSPTAVIFITILCIMLLFAVNNTLAAQKEKTKADPSKTGTWSGKGGKESGRENFMGWCINCHGEKGKGDGPLSTTLGQGIKPRNLTDSKLLSTRTDEFLFKVIREGGASGFSEAMMPHKDMITDEEIKNVILYIRSDICKCKYSK